MPNYKDIQPYTRDGYYRVDIDLEYLEEHIERYIDNYDAELNPDFQRGHVWNLEKQIAFVEHLLRGGQGSNEIRFNCPGWMGRMTNPKMTLVDGLQRVTACLKFLRNEIPAFGYYRREWNGRIPAKAILSIRVNDLETRSEVLQWYLDINEGGIAHTKDELDKVRKLLAQEND